MKQRRYPSKLLLFGEYSLLVGSNALAIPYHGMSGDLRFMPPGVDAGLSRWVTAMNQGGLGHIIDLSRMASDIQKSLRFDSNIPIGYGVGSSGALCAAVYDRYRRNKGELSLEVLQDHLSLLEGHFHQRSSGMDPLVSYLNASVLLENGKWRLMRDIGGDQIMHHFFLLNTGTSRATAPLVERFHDLMKHVDFKKTLTEDYIPYSNRAIRYFIQGSIDKLHRNMDLIHRWQMRNMRPMIPDEMMSLYEVALQENVYRLKFCGAGGGGYFLGMSTNFESTKRDLKQYELTWL